MFFSSVDIRLLAPYEYMDSLNQRQIWEPFLTGRERQEFDTHLRVSILIFKAFLNKHKLAAFKVPSGSAGPDYTVLYYSSKDP